MRERRYGAKGERACKLNCKYFCRLDCRYTCKYTYKYSEFFLEKNAGGGNEGGMCGSACKFSYKSTYKYLGFFSEGEGSLWKGHRERGRGFPRFFVGFRPGR